MGVVGGKINFRNMKTNFFIPISIVLAGLLIAGTILFTSGKGNNTGDNNARLGPNQPGIGSGNGIQVVVTDTDPSIGNANAPVTLIAFEDFECPFCERFSQQTLPLIIEQQVKSGKVRIVWKDFPLSIHSNAQKAHEAARCAWEQDKFWGYHNVLFNNQNSLSINNLKQYSRNLGLNEDQFASCLDSGKYTALIREKVSEGNAMGVSGTPSFLINGKLVVGAQPYQTFVDIINQAAQ